MIVLYLNQWFPDVRSLWTTEAKLRTLELECSPPPPAHTQKYNKICNYERFIRDFFDLLFLIHINQICGLLFLLLALTASCPFFAFSVPSLCFSMKASLPSLLEKAPEALEDNLSFSETSQTTSQGPADQRLGSSNLNKV